MADKNTNRDTGGRIGAFIAGATAAAAAGAYFLYGPKGTENRKKIESWTLKAKGDVLAKLENTKELTEEKYDDIVDNVTAKYGRMKSVGEEKADKLNAELKRHWKRIQKDTKDTAGNAKKRTNTVRRKLADTIDPDDEAESEKKKGKDNK